MPRWLVFSLLTVVCWGVWGVLFKPLEKVAPEGAAALSSAETQAFSTLGILPIMVAMAVSVQRRKERQNLRGSLLAFLSGVLVGVGCIAYYQALAAGTEAATAVALTALYPVATIILAFLFLKEKPHPAQLAGIVISLVAIYLLSVTEPGAAVSPAALYALAPVVLWGGSALLMKMATHNVSAELGTFWFLAAFVPLAAVIMVIAPAITHEPIRWSLSAYEWLVVAAIGATYGLGNLTVLAAYRCEGKASVVTPLCGMYFMVTIPLALVFFHEQVTRWQWVGIALALVAAVALSQEAQQPAAET